MPHSYGYRARTRDMFCKDFRKAGLHQLSKYFVSYKIGDIVDIKCDGSVMDGMPHKFYHGRTGVVFNVTKQSVGVEVNKVLRGKILKKRCHFRIEHVSQSKCRLDFLKRVKDNEVKKAAAKKAGQKNIVLKRIPGQPRSGEFIDASNVEIIKPAAYEFLV
jgi:large subunit ribosomal protein L21e